MFRSEPIGAPGVYFRPDPPSRGLRPERMDVCGFVGIAPRGPSRVPELPEGWRREDGPFVRQWINGTFPTRRTIAVPVDSFDDYKRQFGGFEGPGNLPYAVEAFFEQGGRRAWISRIVHDMGGSNTNFHATAVGVVDGAVTANGEAFEFVARNEGRWGNRLRAALGYNLRPLQIKAVDLSSVTVDIGEPEPVGSLLRLRFPGDVYQLRFVDRVIHDRMAGRRNRRLEFDVPLPAAPEAVEVVEGELIVDDGAGAREVFHRLGLSSRHPRWVASIVCYDSEFVYPGSAWSDSELSPEQAHRLPIAAVLPPLKRHPQPWGGSETAITDEQPPQFGGGRDCYQDLVHEDFFDARWHPGELNPGSGICSFADHKEISSLVVPDLYCADPLGDIDTSDEPVSLASGEFEECVHVELPPVDEPEPTPVNPLCLNPRLGDDLRTIMELQNRLVQFADQTRDVVVLLDVPPGLTRHQVFDWRSQFRSSYAACYWPWLQAARNDDDRDRLIRINPSAVAAGIIAARELSFGVSHGPANCISRAVINVDEPLSEAQHDQLHPMGINVYLKERDGVRLTAARTLSRDPSLRQLSVRRLMILLVRVLQRQTHWMVFEPNNRRLWRDVRRMLHNFLADLYRSGVFKGSTEEEAFFVRCDEHTNPRPMVDAGKLIAEIGVAPAEPLEFIVLRITRDGDSTLVSEI